MHDKMVDENRFGIGSVGYNVVLTIGAPGASTTCTEHSAKHTKPVQVSACLQKGTETNQND